MYSADRVLVKLRVCPAMVSDVIDLFGREVRFEDEDETGVTVTTQTNALAAAHFAKSYGPDVVLLEPASLREQVKKELETACEAYQE